MKIQVINSKGHWAAGWFRDSDRLEGVIEDVLNKSNIQSMQTEVSSEKELEKLLEKITSDTLIWTNAYYVDLENGGKAWLNSFVEKKGLPLLGSSSRVLENLIKKDTCQAILNENSIPIPRFKVLLSENSELVEQFLFEIDIPYPLVLKTTTGWFSLGVSLAHNIKEAIEKAQQILIDFPDSNLIVEEFLPNDDITCGYLEMGSDILLLPVHYRYLNKPGKTNIYTFADRLLEDNANLQRDVVSDQAIIDQLVCEIPKIVQALGVRDITRIDGRMDINNTLRYFDINGFPGLGFKGVVSDLVAICFLFYPDYSQAHVYSALIHTIIANTLIRSNLPVPEAISALNLFTLESDLVIRTKKNISIPA